MLYWIDLPLGGRLAIMARPRAGGDLARTLALRLIGGGSIAIHCRAGIGRSSPMAACVLAASGVRCDEAFAAVGRARGSGVPDTPAQRDWVAVLEETMNRSQPVSAPTG